MLNILYIKTRKEWRAWLQKHHKSEKDVWLIYYKKHTGEATIPYENAVMVFPANKLDQSVYSTDPKNGGPWIMWAGTPYEHLMIPVK